MNEKEMFRSALILKFWWQKIEHNLTLYICIMMILFCTCVDGIR